MIVNCHTHVFNVKCAPDKFIGPPIAKLLSIPPVSFFLMNFLKAVCPGEKDFLEKYGNFIEIGRKKSQELVFEQLKTYYPSDTKFIVLTIDMDFMGAGDAILNYPSQLYQVIQIKRKCPDRFLPFISIDPRRGTASSLLEFLKKHMEELGFCGIKLYPSLGFFPFDQRLNEVYKYAQDKQIPIIMHCTKGGIFYRGKTYTSDQLRPTNLNSKPLKQYDFSENYKMKNHEFRDIFLNPENFLEVLEVYNKLKICFAHYGDCDEVVGSKIKKEDSWYNTIRNLLCNPKYPNVYTDISYTLSDKKVFDLLLADIRDSAINKKILFGTDFFMTMREKREDDLYNDFRKILTGKEFELISKVNPETFLG